MYLIDIQNPTHRNKIKTRASMFDQQISTRNKEIVNGAFAYLDDMIITDYTNHFMK